MVELVKAKDGTDTLKVNNKFLHSSYSPQKEVSRFLDKQINEPSKIFIILGESLGLIKTTLKSKYSHSKFLTFYYLSPSHSTNDDNDWNPNSQQNVNDFLQTHLNDSDIPGITIVSWPNSELFFSEIHTEVTTAVNAFVRIRTNSLITTGNFGRKWIRNSIVNLRNKKALHIFDPPTDKPIVIAASGCSLAASVHQLKRGRNSFYLWALPSSIDFLLYHGLIPDFVIQTDPGFYASHHIRVLNNIDIDLAYPITSLPPEKIKGKSYIFSQHSEIEQLLLEKNSSDLLTIPSTGTVAAAAILLAVKAQVKEIYLLGLDLISTDVHSHVTPHSFEPILDIDQTRVNSKLTILFDRNIANGKRGTEGWQAESLKTYADWFNTLPSQVCQSIYRVNPSSVSIPQFKCILENQFIERLKKVHFSIPLKDKANLKIVSKNKSEFLDSFEKLIEVSIEKLKKDKCIPSIDNRLLFLFKHLSMIEYLAFLKVNDEKQNDLFLELLQNCSAEISRLRLDLQL